MKHQSLESLKQGVVQIPGYSFTFGHALFQPRLYSDRDLLDANCVYRKENQARHDNKKRTEPPRFNEGWWNGIDQSRPGFWPCVHICGRNDLERVLTR